MEWYRGIFQRLGIRMTADTEHCLRLQTQCRATRLAKLKTAEGKKRRVDKCHKNLLTKTALAKREKAKRQGAHKTAIGIDGRHTDAELQQAKALFPHDYVRAEQQQTARANRNNKECKHCQGTGHVTWRSKACGEHQAHLDSRKAPPQSQSSAEQVNNNETQEGVTAEDNDVHTGVDTAAAQTARDASECEVLDSLALDGVDEEFFDCDTCSDDESIVSNRTDSSDKENKIN